MSRNGSGTYNLPTGNPVVTGTTITSTWANTTLSDMANALTGSVASDGQTPMSGNLNMATNKVTNLGTPSASTDAVTKGYVDTAISGIGSTALLKANNLSDVADVTTSRTNLSAAKSGANSDITSLSGLATALSVGQGGTGQTSFTDGQLLIGNTTGNTLAKATLTAGINTTITNGSGAITIASSAYPLTNGTVQNTTSGTSIDFTSIPSWVKRITVMFNGVSTNGTSNIIIQLGSTTFTTSGYLGTNQNGNGGVATTAMSTGFLVAGGVAAAGTQYGSVILTTLGSNIWTEMGILGQPVASAVYNFSGGGITLSGTLDRIRITTANGTDTFDAGSINIMYE